MLAEADYPTVAGKGLRVDTSEKSMYSPLVYLVVWSYLLRVTDRAK